MTVTEACCVKCSVRSRYLYLTCLHLNRQNISSTNKRWNKNLLYLLFFIVIFNQSPSNFHTKGHREKLLIRCLKCEIDAMSSILLLDTVFRSGPPARYAVSQQLQCCDCSKPGLGWGPSSFSFWDRQRSCLAGRGWSFAVRSWLHGLLSP